MKRYIKEYVSSYVPRDRNIDDFESNGLYVEYLYELRLEYRNIINDYIKQYDPTIRIANVIDNLMPKDISYNLVSVLRNKHEGLEEDILESAKPGRNLFSSFLKVVSAMGGRNNGNVTLDTPDDYILYYKIENIDSDKFESIISNRFKSLKNFVHFSNQEDTHIYFGVNSNMKVEYGTIIGNNHNEIGSFPLTESSKKWILSLKSQSASAFKHDLIDNDVKEIKFLSTIKTNMIKQLNDMSIDRDGIYLDDDILVIPMRNLGIWDNGKITTESINALKVKMNQSLLKYKWSERILTTIQANDYIVNFLIKIK